MSIGSPDAFTKACDEMSCAKFIMSDKYITQVLKSIAAYPRLYEILACCVKDYDFPAALAAASISVAPNVYKIKYPESREEFCAFVFSMLWEIDAKRLNLTRFLQEFYMSDTDNINTAYKNWCYDVILKFKRTALGLLNINNDKLYYNNEVSRPLNRAQAEEISTYVSEMIIFLSKESDIDIDVREELYVLAQLLNSSLNGRPKLVYGLWIGLKNTAKPFSFLNYYLDNIERLLKTFGIINVG
ncbi:MAG TPA: hypothetical protein VIL26_06020 [Clostridia bacterium]